MRISDWSSDVCSSDLELEGMIVSGELSGGDRLNETVLAERFGVSRGPVREACRGLERSGLIRFVANRGVFVREMNVKEALALFDVRAALFALAGTTLAPRLAAAQVQRPAALIGAMSDERKSAVSGKRVDVRVDLGGRR